MRDPQIVLKQLSGLKENQRVTNIYCNLYNPEFYKLAYLNIIEKTNNLDDIKKKSKPENILTESRINKLIQRLRDKTYVPTKISTSVDESSFDDLLVQEIIRLILSAIFESHFAENVFGYVRKYTPHSALEYVYEKFRGTKWWITIDVSHCIQNMNHVMLIDFLKERIREQKFIHLINLFLKSGYVNVWEYDKTYSGTPIGTIIGSILFNIYMNKFDKYMVEKINEFNMGVKRKRSKEYHRVECRVSNVKRRIKNNINVDENRLRYKEYKKAYRKFVSKYGVYDYYDPDFKRLNYIRYFNSLLIGTISSKKEAESIKSLVDLFFNNVLKITNVDSIIVHNSENIRFLGYDVSVMRCDTHVQINGTIGLWLPYEVCKKFIIDNEFGKFTKDARSGKPKLKAVHISRLANSVEFRILQFYNTKIKRLYNYYKYASNICKLNGFNYICQVSFLRTLALKYKTSCAKLYANKNYNHRLNNSLHIGITYCGKFYPFFDGPFKVVKFKTTQK